MKLFVSIVAVTAAFFIFSCTKKTVNTACYDAELKEMMKDSNCVGVAHGVCGCDGITYTNECEALKAGYEIIDTIPCGQR